MSDLNVTGAAFHLQQTTARLLEKTTLQLSCHRGGMTDLNDAQKVMGDAPQAPCVLTLVCTECAGWCKGSCEAPRGSQVQDDAHLKNPV
jgi:hypothetical protein